MEDNQVKPTAVNAGAGIWADEFQQQHPRTWASEFTDGQVCILITIPLIMSVWKLPCIAFPS